MRHRMSWSVAALSFLLVGAQAHAQQRPGGQNAQANAKPIKVEGAIKSVKDNIITVSSGRDNTVMVMVPPNATLAVTGTAEIAGVTAGMNVDFTAELNKQGELQGEVKELTLRDATDVSVKPGAYDPSDTDGAKPLRGLKDGSNSYLIHAKVRSNKDGEIVVAATGIPAIKLKLASDCVISVNFKNPHLASPGDGIIVNGKQVQPGQVYGEDVTIKLTLPYAPKKKGGATTKAPVSEPDPFGS